MSKQEKLVEAVGLSKRFPVKTGLFQKKKYVQKLAKVA